MSKQKITSFDFIIKILLPRTYKRLRELKEVKLENERLLKELRETMRGRR